MRLPMLCELPKHRVRAATPWRPRVSLKCCYSPERPDAPRSNPGRTPARVVERTEPLLIFVPQRQPNTTEALPQCKSADAAKVGVMAQHQRQPVIGDAAAQMMDVVHADIGGEPAQDDRQVIVGAAVERHFVQVP